ncbi:MAG TPA: hypothetical protein VK446_14080 [Methylocystis sp.]|nr:hypothetical protein [Methylocystis sp.]
MRKLPALLSFICFFCLAGRAAIADEPDFMIAYSLAAVAYCAYTVGDADDRNPGATQPDQGRDRAYECLKAARAADPLLEGLGPKTADDVEVFAKGKDAYLLLRSDAGVALAFRGTLAPPISPLEAQQYGPLLLAKKVVEAISGWSTFASDWLFNAFAMNPLANATRHRGFDLAWQALRSNLKSACGAGPTTDKCSHLFAWAADAKAAGKPLFVTGHSKGGALATLAAVDLPKDLPDAPALKVYTFAAAKAFSNGGAAEIAEATKGFWRFEHFGDVVPSVPPDASFPVPPLPAFSQAGSRVFFGKDEQPDVAPPPIGGRDSLDDARRFKEFYDLNPGLFEVPVFATKVAAALANNCGPLRDHFAVFSSVQSVAWKQNPGAAHQAFFKTGLFKTLPPPGGAGDPKQVEILWGYESWCHWLQSLKSPSFWLRLPF